MYQRVGEAAKIRRVSYLGFFPWHGLETPHSVKFISVLEPRIVRRVVRQYR